MMDESLPGPLASLLSPVSLFLAFSQHWKALAPCAVHTGTARLRRAPLFVHERSCQCRQGPPSILVGCCCCCCWRRETRRERARSRRLSAGYIWTRTGVRGLGPSSKSRRPVTLLATPHMGPVRQPPWAARTLDWLEETTPSASVCMTVQLIPSSSRRPHGRRARPQAPMGSRLFVSTTCITLLSSGPVLRTCPALAAHAVAQLLLLLFLVPRNDSASWIGVLITSHYRLALVLR